ncbi:MAG: hypothetical protein NVS3B20_12280 [Polyangiales bacterium]
MLKSPSEKGLRPPVIPSQSHSPGETPPAQGAPWDLPIAEAPFAFLDLEMTGLCVGEDRVIEICIERWRGDVCEGRLDQVLNPTDRSGAATEHVHGLSAELLASSPLFSTIAAEASRLLEGSVVVAHAAAWDLAFLADELGRVGLAAHAPTHAIDTLVLSRRALHLPSYALQNIAKSLAIPVERAHRAGDDVRTMRILWAHLLAELKPMSPRDLWQVRVGERSPPDSMRRSILESLEKSLREGASLQLVYRPARRSPEHLSIVITALVPPHAIGYLLPGRGLRELRIDRILRIEPNRS